MLGLVLHVIKSGQKKVRSRDAGERNTVLSQQLKNGKELSKDEALRMLLPTCIEVSK